MTIHIREEIALVVWDWNGTIFDDARICQDITNIQLQHLGLKTLRYETQEILFKHPVKEYYEDMGIVFDDGQFETLSTEFHQIYGKKRGEGKVREDAINCLQRVRDAGKEQVVLSAYRENDLQSLVSQCELTDYFTAVLGLSDCHAVSKVRRGVDWIQEKGIAPERVLIIGDTNHDFEVAQAIGAKCILTPSGYQHWNLLVQTGVPVIDSLSELIFQ